MSNLTPKEIFNKLDNILKVNMVLGLLSIFLFILMICLNTSYPVIALFIKYLLFPIVSLENLFCIMGYNLRSLETFGLEDYNNRFFELQYTVWFNYVSLILLTMIALTV